MATVRIDLRATGRLSNKEAKQFIADVDALRQRCLVSDLEVRGAGCDVTYDEEPPPEQAPEILVPASEDDGA